ncbi:hypothetical protein INR49_032157 [Caranx melampygus]|nr:hypothetical protein INR49_032157 [Caranx melampygus]
MASKPNKHRSLYKCFELLWKLTWAHWKKRQNPAGDSPKNKLPSQCLLKSTWRASSFFEVKLQKEQE